MSLSAAPCEVSVIQMNLKSRSLVSSALVVEKVWSMDIVIVIKIFTDQLHMTVNRCYESVATVKKEQLKMVHLKRNSAPKAPNRSVRYFQALFGFLTSVDAVDLKHPEKV